MKYNLAKTVVFSIVITAAGFVFGQENRYNIKYDLSPGSKFTLSYTSDDTRIFKMGERQAKSEVNTDFELSFNTISGDLNTGFTLEAVINGFDVQSRGPIESPSPDFSPLKGKKIGFVLTPLGKVHGYSGFESLPEIDLGPEGKLNRDRYISNFKYLFPVFPEKSVQTGESWQDKFTETVTDEGGKTTVVTDVIYTLSGETLKDGHECLIIDTKFNLEVNGKGKSQGADFTITSTGTGDGVIYFAKDKGFVIYMETNIGSKGEMSVSANKFPLFSETTTKVAVKFN